MAALGRFLASQRAKALSLFAPNQRFHVSRTLASQAQAVSHGAQDGEDNFANAKPFSEIPSRSVWNPLTYYNLYKYWGKLHNFVVVLREEMGPIYQGGAGAIESVSIFDPKDIETLYRHDGNFPVRMELEAWNQFRIDTGRAFGILQANGENWRRMRRVIERQTMRPHNALAFTDDLKKVATDLIDKMVYVRDNESDGKAVTGMDQMLFSWALESVAVVIYEERLGCLEGERDPEMTEFINAVQDFFQGTMEVVYFPYKWAKRLVPKSYERYFKGHDTLFRIGGKIIDRKIAKLEKEIAEGKEVHGFIAQLLSSKKLSAEEIYACVTEMMAAGVDTTSNTLQFALYELAKHPEVQERLFQEISKVIPEGEELQKEHIQHMSYVKAIIKETMRLYPVAFSVSRLTEEDMVLGGYQVPAGTLVTMFPNVTGRDPNYFEEPDAFKPERWLREAGKQTDTLRGFASMPFGHGARVCVGRRIAELEMQVFLTQLCRRFVIKPNSDEPLETITRMLLTTKKPVDIQLIDRE